MLLGFLSHLSDGYIQEENARVLAHQRELWHREHDSQAITKDRDRDHSIAKMELLKGYIDTLIDKLRGQGMQVPLKITIPDLDPQFGNMGQIIYQFF